MTMTSIADAEAGQAVYSPRVLSLYDWWVVRFSNRFAWKCPWRRLLKLYNECVSDNHLDVGVGTGFFLNRCRFPSSRPRLALLDMNANCLETTALRVARYDPIVHRANVLEPIEIEEPPFDSIGLNYLLHCLPGTMQSKAAAFDNLRPLMSSTAVLFGSTILYGGVQRGWLARRLMKTYNEQKIFSNEHDDLEGLRQALSDRFSEVNVEVVGCVALFQCRN